MKPLDWVDGLSGIGQLISLNTIYSDELDNLESNKEIGIKLREIAIYKVLCDFEGNVRKRVLFDHGNTSICTPISQESQRIIDSLSISNPTELKAFKDKTTNKVFGEWLYLPIPYEQNLFKSLKSVGNSMKEFTFIQFIEELLDNDIDIKSLMSASVSKPYISLDFYNKDYKYTNKKRVISHVNCTLIE